MPKIFRGKRAESGNVVTVDGEVLERRLDGGDDCGFDWGSGDPRGANQLAATLLDHCLGPNDALPLAPKFLEEVVAKLSAEWELSSDDVAEWQEANANRGGSGARPRILRDPNYRVKGRTIQVSDYGFK